MGSSLGGKQSFRVQRQRFRRRRGETAVHAEVWTNSGSRGDAEARRTTKNQLKKWDQARKSDRTNGLFLNFLDVFLNQLVAVAVVVALAVLRGSAPPREPLSLWANLDAARSAPRLRCSSRQSRRCRERLGRERQRHPKTRTTLIVIKRQRTVMRRRNRGRNGQTQTRPARRTR